MMSIDGGCVSEGQTHVFALLLPNGCVLQSHSLIKWDRTGVGRLPDMAMFSEIQTQEKLRQQVGCSTDLESIASHPLRGTKTHKKLLSGCLRHLQNPIKLHPIHLHNPFCTTSWHDVPVPLDCLPRITCNLYTIPLKSLRGAFYSCMSPSVIRNECGFQSRNQFETWRVCGRSFEHRPQPYSFKSTALCSSRVISSSCPSAL